MSLITLKYVAGTAYHAEGVFVGKEKLLAYHSISGGVLPHVMLLLRHVAVRNPVGVKLLDECPRIPIHFQFLSTTLSMFWCNTYSFLRRPILAVRGVTPHEQCSHVAEMVSESRNFRIRIGFICFVAICFLVIACVHGRCEQPSRSRQHFLVLDLLYTFRRV